MAPVPRPSTLTGGGGGNKEGLGGGGELSNFLAHGLINQSINQTINQLYLNTVNGSASWFSDMPCDNYNL